MCVCVCVCEYVCVCTDVCVRGGFGETAVFVMLTLDISLSPVTSFRLRMILLRVCRLERKENNKIIPHKRFLLLFFISLACSLLDLPSVHVVRVKHILTFCIAFVCLLFPTG